jgi:hypothetical protein
VSEDIFTVGVPEEALDAPDFEPIPSGLYRTVFQAAEIVRGTNNPDWRGLKPRFEGFTPVSEDGTETGGKAYPGLTLDRSAFTLANPTNAKSVAIGYAAAVGLARALGLAVQRGSGQWALPIESGDDAALDDLATQCNACAGTEVQVYIKTGPRKPKRAGDTSHLKQDGTPWTDSEIKRVCAVVEEDA